MKTTKKDWIYRVILLILLAIIWDIGAALTSPIFVPQKGAVFREFFLLIWIEISKAIWIVGGLMLASFAAGYLFHGPTFKT